MPHNEQINVLTENLFCFKTKEPNLIEKNFVNSPLHEAKIWQICFPPLYKNRCKSSHDAPPHFSSVGKGAEPFLDLPHRSQHHNHFTLNTLLDTNDVAHTLHVCESQGQIILSFIIRKFGLFASQNSTYTLYQ